MFAASEQGDPQVGLSILPPCQILYSMLQYLKSAMEQSYGEKGQKEGEPGNKSHFLQIDKLKMTVL